MDAPIMGKTHRPPGKDLQPLLAAFAKNPVAALLRGIQDLASTVPAPTRGAPPDGSRESLPFALHFQRHSYVEMLVSRDDRATARGRAKPS